MYSMTEFDVGKADITPEKPVVAGSYVTETITYTVGHPIDDTGYIKIVFRYSGDYGEPQFDNPKAPNYVKITTTGDCRLDTRWDPKGNRRPWGKTLSMKVMGGYLNRGDKVKIVFGDRSQGSPGWRVQTFCEDSFEFKFLIDPVAAMDFHELPESPTLKVIPGKPHKAVCIAPSQVEAGKKFEYYLKLEDKWGNPVAKPATLTHPGFDGTGIEYITATDKKTKLSAVSNPVKVCGKLSGAKYFWGDFHAQSEETIGINDIDYFFTFIRDYALLDIGGHQGNDFQISDAFWTKINKATKKFNRDGKFVAFPGYEWSGNTPLGGDRNVYYPDENGEIYRSSFELIPGKKSKYPEAPTAREMFKLIKKFKPFVFAHVGGRYADVALHASSEVAMEIHSGWGTFEWLLHDALKMGYRVGVCANSDDHKARPGASYPGAKLFGSFGGYTCVLAPELARKTVYNAMLKRHFYATTGARILLDISMQSGKKSAIMGDVIKAGKEVPVFSGKIAGTAPIETVEVFNGEKLMKTYRLYGKKDLGKRVKVIWSGAEVRGRDRAVDWKGSLKITGGKITGFTPVNFLNPDTPLTQTGDRNMEWSSYTTGGVAGMILELDKPDTGKLEISTEQASLKLDIGKIGLKPKVKSCGGVEKQLTVYRLPDQLTEKTFEFNLQLKNLHSGDNPIYLKVTQEDGNFAWSSPIYLEK